MTAVSSGQLYTPEMLSLATHLADTPPQPDLPLGGTARSTTCGGVLTLDLRMTDGRVSDLGMLVQACAVGQASAALFAKWASGKSPAQITASQEDVAQWLAGNGPVPASPDLSPIAAAQAFSGRHGAIVLPWRAFADALCNTET